MNLQMQSILQLPYKRKFRFFILLEFAKIVNSFELEEFRYF